MGRAVTSRTVGSGVWPLDGTLSFIKSNNLQNAIAVSYASTATNAGSLYNRVGRPSQYHLERDEQL